MLSKRFMSIVLVVAFIILAGFTVNSYAGTSVGRVCLSDGFGGLWVMDVGSFGTESFEVTGFRIGASCNGTTVQPMTGTVTVIGGNNIVIGAMTLTNEVDVCTTTSWNIIFNLDTMSGVNGAWSNMYGSQGNFTMDYVDCPLVMSLKGTGEGISNDPARIKK